MIRFRRVESGSAGEIMKGSRRHFLEQGMIVGEANRFGLRGDCGLGRRYRPTPPANGTSHNAIERCGIRRGGGALVKKDPKGCP